ncbi:BTA121 domain-containing protein surface lipoprotein [Borrelia persica]|uniref:BTA121 domain-containing protein surface lipoprotein n=1 Tax=Borrelia persica TaxID=44448 RepID=UPI000467DD7A|nr:hypothetical protein [Borrelia persica]
MKKHLWLRYLWLLMILSLLISCSPQKTRTIRSAGDNTGGNGKLDPRTIYALQESQSNAHIMRELSLADRLIFNFLESTVKDMTIAQDIQPYQKINEFSIHLKAEKIREMLTHIKARLDLDEKLEKEIKRMFNDDPQKTEFQNRLEQAMINYKANLKRATNTDSFDEVKTNIENVPIDEIRQIEKDIEINKQMTSIRLQVDTDNDMAYELFNEALKDPTITVNDPYTNEQYNQLLINLKAKKLNEILKKIRSKLTLIIRNTKNELKKISGDNQEKDQLKKTIKEIRRTYQISIRKAIGTADRTVADNVKIKIEKVDPPNEINTILNQARQIVKDLQKNKPGGSSTN